MFLDHFIHLIDINELVIILFHYTTYLVVLMFWRNMPTLSRGFAIDAHNLHFFTIFNQMVDHLTFIEFFHHATLKRTTVGYFGWFNASLVDKFWVIYTHTIKTKIPITLFAMKEAFLKLDGLRTRTITRNFGNSSFTFNWN
jgi:hypothetical protein